MHGTRERVERLLKARTSACPKNLGKAASLFYIITLPYNYFFIALFCCKSGILDCGNCRNNMSKWHESSLSSVRCQPGVGDYIAFGMRCWPIVSFRKKTPSFTSLCLMKTAAISDKYEMHGKLRWNVCFISVTSYLTSMLSYFIFLGKIKPFIFMYRMYSPTKCFSS